MKYRTPEVVIFEYKYPSGRKNDKEIDLLCTRSGYKIIKSTLDLLEIEGHVKYVRLNST